MITLPRASFASVQELYPHKQYLTTNHNLDMKRNSEEQNQKGVKST